MVDLSTRYMGIPLRNPIVVGSSSLTGSLAGIKKCAEAGAGAIVLKSLFEEQISAETGQMSEYADYVGHGEAAEYLQGYGMELGPNDYLKLVGEAKKAVDVPIIPSLNCISHDRWGSYAKKLESAGADAIELNVGLMPTNAKQEGPAIEEEYYRILHNVKNQVRIPVAMKIGPYFSSFAHFTERLCHDKAEGPPFTVGWIGSSPEPGKIVWQAVDALVLFNRFYQFDIDIDKMELVAGNPYSTSLELHTALRWIALLHGRVDCDLVATTGIHNGADAVKQLLAGATVVQVCSALYQNGLGQVGRILEQIEAWMQAHSYTSLDQFRGKLSQARSDRPRYHERLQYIKLFGGIE